MGESVHHTVPLLEVRLIRHKDQIEEIYNHLREILVDRIESVEQEIETLRDRAEAAEKQIEVLHDSLGIARDRITESQIRMEDAEARLQQSEQGMNLAAIKQLIAQCIVDAMIAYGANRASGNRAHNETSGSARGVEHTVRNCSYKEFLTCEIFRTHVAGRCTNMVEILCEYIGLDAAYETTWKELKQMMIDKCCLRNEVQKMEIKLWNLSVKGTDITHQYIQKGCHVFLAHIKEKKSEEKSKEKRLEDVPIVRDFTEVFPEDLPGLLPETDNPDITIEEYVQYETKKALRNGQVYNWETAKYGMINWCLDIEDIDCLKTFETKFPAIVYDDASIILKDTTP
ncbi:hypothetical protein Tco_1360676 [Tanacetum coccineum]